MKKEYRQQKIAEGKCPTCGARPPIAGKKACRVCLDRAKRNAQKRRKDKPQETKKVIANWRKNNSKANKQIFDRHYSKLRQTVFEHYGMTCVCCGESFEFLTLDHIYGGGTEHRQQIFGQTKGGNGGGKFYRWVIQNDFPDYLQPLCMNCNWAKAKYGICPHQKRSQSSLASSAS